MKKLVLFCFAACWCAMASAQKVYFLYLQSDNQTPFYVKMGDKIHSSAASGYLILPNLTEGNYTFSLGYVKSSETEAVFSVAINQNDKGYIIKSFNEALTLFDVQDLSLLKANALQQDNTAFETKTDKFSTILSKAANDPGLLKVPVTKKEELAKQKPAEQEPVLIAKVEETKPVEQSVTDTRNTQAQTTETVKTELPKQEPITNEVTTDIITTQTVSNETKEPAVRPVQQEKSEFIETQSVLYKPSVVSRYSESSTTEGFGVIYFDKNVDGTDTIRILIPVSKLKLVADTETASATEVQTKVDRIVTAVETKKEIENSPKESPSQTIAVNQSNCKSVASDKDFFKLRKKMASKDNNDAMLDEARKEFRSKCYSVEQVRYLSTLFLTSASKYQFFDIAYYYVSDKSNFISLGSEIKDEHYTKRFKALIGE